MELTIVSRQNKEAKVLRKEGLVPCIVYGKHMTTPLSLACNKNDFIKKYKEAGYSTPLTLTGEGIDQLVLIQDIQLDPVSDVLLHVDFLAVNKNEKVTTEVPIKLTGEAPIEKTGEGKIQLIKDFIEVEAFPQDLPHDITIDISTIQTMNDAIFVKDLKISNKVEILDDLDQVIVTVLSMTEEVEEETASTAAPTEAATTETAKEEQKKE